MGWTDLTAPDVVSALAALRALPGGDRLTGIRHQVQGERDPRWLLRPDVLRGLAAVADARLAYDLIVRPHQLPAARAAAELVPGLTFVLDHAGKPPVAEGVLTPWADDLRALAALPHTVCKLSGLVTEADPRRWRDQDLRPYTDVLLDAFGPDRLMFGSDWPVSPARRLVPAGPPDREHPHRGPLRGRARRRFRRNGDPRVPAGLKGAPGRPPGQRWPTVRGLRQAGDMPELPEVEALRVFLGDHLVGREIAHVLPLSVNVLKTYDPPPAALDGATVTSVDRHGKFLDIGAGELHLVTHLARAGWLQWRETFPAKPPGPGKGPLAFRAVLTGGTAST